MLKVDKLNYEYVVTQNSVTTMADTLYVVLDSSCTDCEGHGGIVGVYFLKDEAKKIVSLCKSNYPHTCEKSYYTIVKIIIGESQWPCRSSY